MDNWRLISIKTWISIYGYLFLTDVHCGMSLHGYPCLDINVDIHACIDNWRLTSKKHGYPCWYPWIFGNPCMDLLWILGPGKRLALWKRNLWIFESGAIGIFIHFPVMKFQNTSLVNFQKKLLKLSNFSEIHKNIISQLHNEMRMNFISGNE